RHAGRRITLQTVPERILKDWQRLGFTHIWLMGVWSAGEIARNEAVAHEDLKRAYSEVLPGWKSEDVAASPYAVADYAVPASLGGEEGLKHFRERLNAHGMKLLLDFVPNHLGRDHPWIAQHPDYFVQSPTQSPGTFSAQADNQSVWLAYGKDPFF